MLMKSNTVQSMMDRSVVKLIHYPNEPVVGKDLIPNQITSPQLLYQDIKPNNNECGRQCQCCGMPHSGLALNILLSTCTLLTLSNRNDLLQEIKELSMPSIFLFQRTHSRQMLS